MNIYAHVKGDPVNEDDPEGTDATEIGELVVTGSRPYVANAMNAGSMVNQNLIGGPGLGGIGSGQVVPLSQASKLPAAPKEKPKTPAAKEKPKKGCPTAVVGKVEASIGLQLAGEVSTVGFSGGGVFDLGSLRAGWSSDDGFYTKGTQEFSLSGGILGATVTGGWKREGTLGTGANPGSFMNKPLSSVTDGEFKPFTIGGASLAGVKVEAGICVPQ